MTLPLEKIREPQVAPASRQVELRSVTKRYGNAQPVLEDINLSIPESEFVSIIGASGCGKSTLLKLVAGLTRLSSGSMRVAGLEPVRARKMMSFMFQDATLLPWRTVQRNVELSTELHGVKKRNAPPPLEKC
jgi:NitT/TauT family transport system ATP-binding protein